jgi:hypothetical protein
MYLPDLIQQGIAETLPAEGTLHDPQQEYACALGCAKVVLDEARWTRVREHLTRTKVCRHSLPDDVTFESDTVIREIDDSPSLHLVITSLNDLTGMSRKAIAEWLETLPSGKIDIGFGQDRDTDPLQELQAA